MHEFHALNLLVIGCHIAALLGVQLGRHIFAGRIMRPYLSFHIEGIEMDQNIGGAVHFRLLRPLDDFQLRGNGLFVVLARENIVIFSTIARAEDDLALLVKFDFDRVAETVLETKRSRRSHRSILIRESLMKN